jgi:hypothetical protein
MLKAHQRAPNWPLVTRTLKWGQILRSSSDTHPRIGMHYFANPWLNHETQNLTNYPLFKFKTCVRLKKLDDD